jgi:hypothetical protein
MRSAHIRRVPSRRRCGLRAARSGSPDAGVDAAPPRSTDSAPRDGACATDAHAGRVGRSEMRVECRDTFARRDVRSGWRPSVRVGSVASLPRPRAFRVRSPTRRPVPSRPRTAPGATRDDIHIRYWIRIYTNTVHLRSQDTYRNFRVGTVYGGVQSKSVCST